MLIVLEQPSAMAVSLPLAKQHLRVDFDDDDTVITAYLKAAIGYVEHETSRVLAPTVFQLRLPGWPQDRRCHSCSAVIEIPACPIREVEQVSYIGDDGVDHVLSGNAWTFVPTAVGGEIRIVDGALPALQSDRSDAVRVTFGAGYDITGASGSGDDPNLRLPDLATAAVLILMAHYYQNRETVNIGSSVSELPFSVAALIQALSVYR